MANKPKNPRPASKTQAKGAARAKPSPDTAEETAPSEEILETAETAETAKSSAVESVPDAVVIEETHPPESVAQTAEADAAQSPENAVPPPVHQPTKTPSTASLIIGGLIAGVIGILAATLLPDSWINRSDNAEVASSAAVEAQSTRIDELTDQVQALSAGVAEAGDPMTESLATLDGRMNDLGPRIDQISQQFEAFATRLETLEARPVISVPNGGDAMAAQLDAFRSESRRYDRLGCRRSLLSPQQRNQIYRDSVFLVRVADAA